MLPIALFLAAVISDLQSALAHNDFQRTRIIETRLIDEQTPVETLLQAGALLAQHDMLTDAATMFETCTKRYPASFEAKYNLALSRIGLHQYAEASAVLNGMPASAPLDYLRGKILLNTGRPAEARPYLQSAYRSSPNEENYALDLALSDIRAAAYVPAIEILQPALARHPESQELTLELALSNALAGKPDDAIATASKLRNATGRLIAAFAQCFQQNYTACESQAAAGLSSPDPDPYLYYLHAEALWNLRPTAARDIINADLDHVSCSVCLLLRSRVSNDPVGDLKKALAKDPNLAPAWYRLSVLYRQQNKTAEAIDALRRYKQLQDNLQNTEIESFRSEVLH